MASNATPEDDDVVIALAEDLADGCQIHELTIGIKQNTEATIRAAIAGATAAKLALGAARKALTKAGGFYDIIEQKDAEGLVVIRNCRLRLVKLLGTSYNDEWGQAGFPNLSTAVPDTRDARFTLLGALKAYFTANPSAESVDMEATAAICTTAHAAVSTARNSVNTGEQAVTDAKAAEAAAMKTLRKRVRGLIDELGQLLADDDSRYEAFGLNIPAQPSAPEGIASLTAVAQGGGKFHGSWPYATRMTGTRIMGKHIGVDDEPHSLGTAEGLEKTFTGLAPGQWELSAISYNEGGDGPASPTITINIT